MTLSLKPHQMLMDLEQITDIMRAVIDIPGPLWSVMGAVIGGMTGAIIAHFLTRRRDREGWSRQKIYEAALLLRESQDAILNAGNELFFLNLSIAAGQVSESASGPSAPEQSMRAAWRDLDRSLDALKLLNCNSDALTKETISILNSYKALQNLCYNPIGYAASQHPSSVTNSAKILMEYEINFTSSCKRAFSVIAKETWGAKSQPWSPNYLEYLEALNKLENQSPTPHEG